MFALLLLPAAGESLAQATQTVAMELRVSGPDGTRYVEESATTVITVTAEYVLAPPSLTTTGTVAPTEATTVTVSVAGGMAVVSAAIVGTHFTAVPDFMLTIPAGATTMTGTFTLTTNSIASGGRTLLVTGTATSFTTFTPTDGAVLWIVSGTTHNAVDLSLNLANVSENSDTTTISVTAAVPATSSTLAADFPFTIVVGASTDSAVEGTDYTTVADFDIVLLAGTRMVTGTFDLTVIDNALLGSDKTLTVSSTSGFAIPANRHFPTTLTITDDEVAASGIALSLSPATVPEGGGETTIMVTATTVPAGAPLGTAATVSVALATGGTAVGSAADADPLGDFSPAALTIADIVMAIGDSEGTGSFTLTVNDDVAPEGNETLIFSGTVDAAAINPTTGLTFDIDPVALTISDDETPQADTIMLSLAPTSVTEGMGTAGTPVDDVATTVTEITVTASIPADRSTGVAPLPVTVSWVPGTDADSASLGATDTDDDFTEITDFVITIAPGMITGSRTFMLTVVDDEEMEGDETLVFSGTLDAAVTGFMDIANVTLTIVDNDGGASESMEAVLPELTRVSVASMIDTVSGRIEQVASGSSGGGSASFAGHSSLAQALAANQQGLNDGDLSLLEALAGSSIALELDGTGTAAPSAGGQAGSSGGIGVWASADYDRISSKADGLGDWDGSQFSLSVGVDGHVSRSTLIGVAASWSKGSAEFDSDATLETDTSLLGLNPYIGWHSRDGKQTAWGTVGYSSGDFEQDQQNNLKTDLKMTVLAVGGSTRFAERSGFNYNIKGDLSTAELTTDATGSLPEVKSKAHRARVAVEAEVNKASDSGGHAMRSVALGLRYDGGDGDTGSGLELDGELGWSGRSLSVSGAANVLLFHTGDLKEWGLAGLIRYTPSHSKGRNLTFRAQPSYGRGESGSGQLWDQQVKDLDEDGGEPEARLVMDAGWGLAALSGRGLVTPYSGIELSESGSRVYRLGSRVAIDSVFNIDLAANRTEDGDSPEHGIGLQLGMQW